MPNPPNPESNQSPKQRNSSRHSLLGFSVTERFHQPQRFIHPPDFTQAQKPRFEYGDFLRWIPVNGETDWGTVIGRFYSYAPHAGNWQWCYLLLLDKTAKSAAWCQFDVAWEEDLEPAVQQ